MGVNFGKGGRDLQEPRRNPGSIIDCSIENLVTLEFPMQPEMIPVRGIQDVFVVQLRIAAFHFSNYIMRFEWSAPSVSAQSSPAPLTPPGETLL